MKIFKVGDTQSTLCNTCQSLETATFQLKDVPFNDNSSVVRQVLVGVCERCGSVTIIPHQSTPMIKKALDVQRKALESRVPAHMIDILNLASCELGGEPDFIPTLMKYYLHTLAADRAAAKDIPRFLQSDLAKGKSEKRLSLKGRHVATDIDVLKATTNISSTTDLLKGIVLKIKEDVLVQRDEIHIKQLKSIIAAVS
ncbi:hypothetical protein EO763_01480 [Pectobacterium odoriferum]|uniref:hypothetical protein n=1 Tax=Pectobacterium odoriferum TaxID=78398 RepID=UPI00137429E6|nr:hypothetical protein [Pectobacterium odoriferum]QHP78736.1 hypothetical protein EO763_01480 [Pectobacterium odoriferum]GKW04257.1 hypothetical protein PEC301877_30700 [Pectobacterium carotovorum subsp. carotovorum]GKX42409.1 hypothetical protein SOASR015_14430 [Pectobacterium carotovorum subsp. carotovorum]GLX55412.1 hypothetical protein Pcaca02_07210 [Pectobacterium carotovorum subsp. carotovorum]